MARQKELTRPPMTEAARDRLEDKIYPLQPTIERGPKYEGVEIDIAMEHLRNDQAHRTMARDVYQQLVRDLCWN